MVRVLVVLLTGLLLLTPVAEGAGPVRLRKAGELRATQAEGPIVTLHWRDRARRETRWEVLRGTKRKKLKRNSTRFTDPRSAPAAPTSTPCAPAGSGGAARARG